MATEGNILVQLRKAQGETNQRLDKLIELQELTVRWLIAINNKLEAREPVA